MTKTKILTDDGCQGMHEAILFGALIIIYILSFLVIMIISSIIYFRKNSFNFFPIVTTFILIIFFYLAITLNSFESPTKLHAELYNDTWQQYSLKLRENNTFKIQVRFDEWSCYYKGNYKISSDTLFLLRDDVQAKTDSVIASIYIIDDSKRLMYPIDVTESIQDSARWLKIMDDMK